jgi:hypothetical protein
MNCTILNATFYFLFHIKAFDLNDFSQLNTRCLVEINDKS